MRKTYTAEQREKLVAEVRATGARVSEVAKRIGISSSTAYLWMKPPGAERTGIREGAASGALATYGRLRATWAWCSAYVNYAPVGSSALRSRWPGQRGARGFAPG